MDTFDLQMEELKKKNCPTTVNVDILPHCFLSDEKSRMLICMRQCRISRWCGFANKILWSE